MQPVLALLSPASQQPPHPSLALKSDLWISGWLLNTHKTSSLWKPSTPEPAESVLWKCWQWCDLSRKFNIHFSSWQTFLFCTADWSQLCTWWQDSSFDGGLCWLDNLLQNFPLRLSNKRHGTARAPSSCRPSHTVDVVFHCRWHSEVYHLSGRAGSNQHLWVFSLL